MRSRGQVVESDEAIGSNNEQRAQTLVCSRNLAVATGKHLVAVWSGARAMVFKSASTHCEGLWRFRGCQGKSA
jgi:prolyl-tRNA editing enzyme YbaK/EbsC (Cys-tRNA(Pro) deacylase)